MTRIQRVRYEALLRVRDFGAAHQDRFPSSSGGTEAFATVAGAVAQIEQHAAAKLVAVREGRRDRIARRKLIKNRMAIIARTSRGVTLPSGAALTLRMPTRRSDVAIVTSARAFLQEAEAHRDQLVRLGLPSTCLSELRAEAEAFDEALKDGRAGRSAVAAAQAGITAAFNDGLAAARLLDIVVPNTIGDDAVALAAWRRDRKVIEGKGRGRSTAPAPPADPQADEPPASAPPEPGPVQLARAS
jgi:hypothetical protein